MVNLISSGPILEGSHGGQSLWMLLGSEKHAKFTQSRNESTKSLLSRCTLIFHVSSEFFWSVPEIWTSKRRSTELLGVSRVVARRCFEQSGKQMQTQF